MPTSENKCVRRVRMNPSVSVRSGSGRTFDELKYALANRINRILPSEYDGNPSEYIRKSFFHQNM